MLYVYAFLVCQYELPYQFYPRSISQIHLFFPSLAAAGLDGCRRPLITFSISYATARVSFQNVNLIIPPTHIHAWKHTGTHNVQDVPYSWSNSPHSLACLAYLALCALTLVYFTSLPPTTACFKPSCSCVCSSFSEPSLLPITLTTIPAANSTVFTPRAHKLFLIFLFHFLFWDNYRFKGGCKEMYKEVPCALPPASSSVDILHNYNSTSKSRSWHWYNS